jgi:NADP-dependent 3-hydroxy acid dehydrogenase YdfG
MRVLITGAARAIGEATAKELTARGHDVVATARDARSLHNVEASQRIELDVRDEESIRRALDRCGELDAIVNNAGISAKGPLRTTRCTISTMPSIPTPSDPSGFCNRSSRHGEPEVAAWSSM